MYSEDKHNITATNKPLSRNDLFVVDLQAPPEKSLTQNSGSHNNSVSYQKKFAGADVGNF